MLTMPATRNDCLAWIREADLAGQQYITLAGNEIIMKLKFEKKSITKDLVLAGNICISCLLLF